MRSAAGVVAVVQGSFYLTEPGDLPVFSVVLASVTALAGLSLVVGFCTTAAGAVVGLNVLATALSWFTAPAANLFDAALPGVLVGVITVAIIFLGPGALSVDARLFGRREIIIPPLSRSTKP